VVESVGSVHVATQVAVGAVVAEIEVTLPVVAKEPTFGSAKVPFRKVVAEVVTCQPAPEPVASSTVTC
jgi:hypothetical protein